MGLAQMMADEYANETQDKEEVSEESVEQFKSDFADYVQSKDLDKRIQAYIDSKLSNDKFNLVAEMTTPKPIKDEVKVEDKPVDTTELSAYFTSLTADNRNLCFEFYNKLKPLLPDSLKTALDTFIVASVNTTSIEDIQKAFDDLGYNVKVSAHKIKYTIPCIRIEFEEYIKRGEDLEPYKKVMEGFGYKYQSKYNNSLFFVE